MFVHSLRGTWLLCACDSLHVHPSWLASINPTWLASPHPTWLASPHSTWLSSPRPTWLASPHPTWLDSMCLVGWLVSANTLNYYTVYARPHIHWYNCVLIEHFGAEMIYQRENLPSCPYTIYDQSIMQCQLNIMICTLPVVQQKYLLYIMRKYTYRCAYLA